MINWRIQPAPADTTILLHVSCKEDGTTPKRIEVESNLGITDITSENDRLTIFLPLERWIKHYRSVEEKTKSRRTIGREFTIGLYFYTDGRPTEMRSDTGDNELVEKFVTCAMDWLVDEHPAIQLNPLTSTVES